MKLPSRLITVTVILIFAVAGGVMYRSWFEETAADEVAPVQLAE